ncbi:UDP-N-acetylmuramoyl-tripeptide--D-alanyl-D-alanine ligase [Cytobacillus sp. FJAT-54145]|uniref:UDP-N-acetylmuramoyl-tripeptide--D-alanyl-D-alanine ligase n=1 Tax=Cytobacillus spartinae TaxID=3299023 RepID=A0ABW6K4Z5_9BACI
MEPILVSKIVHFLEGNILSGSENWYVRHAAVYGRQDIKGANTLVFLYKRDEPDWDFLKKVSPCAVITDKSEKKLKDINDQITVIHVKSVVQAYWKFIEYYRNLFNIPVVAITGTCGKSTTKEMIKQILNQDRLVQATESSKNEPRRSFPYLLGINRKTKAAVFETGLGNPGNIKHQCLIYSPTIGILTTIGAHHLDGCKTLEGYIQAKGEIIEGVREGGTLILNSDDENIKKLSLKQFNGKVVYFGVHPSADYQATNIKFSNNGMTFDLQHNKKSYPVFVPGYGEHQVYNALAAIAAVHAMGLDIKDASRRLKTFKNMERHLEVSSGINGSTIIDDTWTINPTSIEAALNVMDEISKNKKKIVLLGNINRLGDYEIEFHQKVGSMVASRDIHTLITIGEKATEIAKQAHLENFKGNIFMFNKVEKNVKEILLEELDSDTHLLIKGPMSSRSMIDLARSLKL